MIYIVWSKKKIKKMEKVLTKNKKGCYNIKKIEYGDDNLMRNFFGRLLYRFSHFLAGRYGMDELFLPIVVVSCILTLLSSLGRLGLLRLLGTAFLLYALFRVFSKNFQKRQNELHIYLTWKNKLTQKFRLHRRIWQERHEKKYFKCPKCKTYLSVPKGKGKLKICCRKCSHQFIRKA